jgi:hypothetical protein
LSFIGCVSASELLIKLGMFMQENWDLIHLFIHSFIHSFIHPTNAVVSKSTTVYQALYYIDAPDTSVAKPWPVPSESSHLDACSGSGLAALPHAILW